MPRQVRERPNRTLWQIAITVFMLAVSQAGNWLTVPGLKHSACLDVWSCRVIGQPPCMDSFSCPPVNTPLDHLPSPAIFATALAIFLALTIARHISGRIRTPRN